MTKEALIIFTKNPEAGKVKTRLAASLGNETALAVYRQLVAHTVSVTEQLPVDKFVFYSDYIDQQDVWNNKHYIKQLQYGNDLGERMKNAFHFIFEFGYDKAVIVGTDCPELSENIILNAFHKLAGFDVVIGPAFDGGYYLLGLTRVHSQLFTDMEWSNENVLPETISRCKSSGLLFRLLQTLRDVDDEKDLVALNLSKP